MKAIDIANYLVCSSQEMQKPISNAQLQKMLFLIHLKSIEFGQSIIDDKFELWLNGFVIPTVYYKYSNYLATPILRKVDKPILEENDKLICEYILKKYINYSWEQLIDICKKKNPTQFE